MLFFKKKPEQVGKELLALVQEVSAKAGSIDGSIQKAKDIIPDYTLKQVDRNKDRAIEFLAVSFSTIELASDWVIQYIYSRSVFDAARAHGLSGFLVKEAGKHAGAVLPLVGFDGLHNKNYERVLWAAKGLVEIGDNIEDYFFQTVGRFFQGVALYYLNAESLARSALTNGLARVPYAEAQEANNKERLQMLYQMADMARHILDSLSDQAQSQRSRKPQKEIVTDIPLSKLINVIHIPEVRHGPLTFQQYDSLGEIADKIYEGLAIRPDEVNACTSLCWLALADLFFKARVTAIEKPETRRWVVTKADSGEEDDLDGQATVNAAVNTLEQLEVEATPHNVADFLHGVTSWADDPRFDQINEEYHRLIGKKSV